MSEPLAGDTRPAHLQLAQERTGIDPTRAMEVYLSRIQLVRDVAKLHGYAIGVHGSMKRDLDLIAVPWIENPSSPESLVKAIEIAVSGYILEPPRGLPVAKPHGRLAWSIHLGGGPFIDLSVMPPKEAA